MSPDGYSFDQASDVGRDIRREVLLEDCDILQAYLGTATAFDVTTCRMCLLLFDVNGLVENGKRCELRQFEFRQSRVPYSGS